jgi:hypothetical protein
MNQFNGIDEIQTYHANVPFPVDIIFLIAGCFGFVHRLLSVALHLIAASALSSQLARVSGGQLLPLLCHNYCAILCISFFVLPLLWRFCADLNLCSALDQISPETLSSSDDFLCCGLLWGQLILLLKLLCCDRLICLNHPCPQDATASPSPVVVIGCVCLRCDDLLLLRSCDWPLLW